MRVLAYAVALACLAYIAACGLDSFECKSVGDKLYECSRGNTEICTRESGEIVPMSECENADGETYP